MYVCMYIHIHMYTHMYMHVCMYVYTHIYVYTYVCVYIYRQKHSQLNLFWLWNNQNKVRWASGYTFKGTQYGVFVWANPRFIFK